MSALGTEFKINVHMEPIDGFHMADENVGFECYLYVYTNKGVLFRKGDQFVIQQDNSLDDYRIVVTSDNSIKIGRGSVKLKFTSHIPDSDYPDGKRTEIVDGICTGVTIT